MTKQVNPLHATRLPDDVQCYQAALDAAFAAGVAAEREACAVLASKCNKSNNNGTHLYIADAIRARGEA